MLKKCLDAIRNCGCPWEPESEYLKILPPGRFCMECINRSFFSGSKLSKRSGAPDARISDHHEIFFQNLKSSFQERMKLELGNRVVERGKGF